MGWLYAAIAGTPESGKTTLMRLVANELLRIYGEEKPIYCLSGWPQSVYDIGWAARLEKNTGAHGRNWLNYSSYLLLDEAQLLYWHDNLWSEFFESVELLGTGSFIILYMSYGSPHRGFVGFGGKEHAETLINFAPEQ